MIKLVAVLLQADALMNGSKIFFLAVSNLTSCIKLP